MSLLGEGVLFVVNVTCSGSKAPNAGSDEKAPPSGKLASNEDDKKDSDIITKDPNEKATNAEGGKGSDSRDQKPAEVKTSSSEKVPLGGDERSDNDAAKTSDVITKDPNEKKTPSEETKGAGTDGNDSAFDKSERDEAEIIR